MDILRQHFRIIHHQDLLADPAAHGPKIQVLFIWLQLPKATPELLALLPALKVIASGGAGYDHLDLPYLTRSGVRVANTPGVVSECTADMAMGLLLASARNIVEGQSTRSNGAMKTDDDVVAFHFPSEQLTLACVVGGSLCRHIDLSVQWHVSVLAILRSA